MEKLNRKKIDPRTFIFTGEKKTEKVEMQLFEYTKETLSEIKEFAVEDIPAFFGEKTNYWLNIHGLEDTELIAAVCEKQRIHHLVIQDILDVNQRPKFQEFDNFSFLTLKSIAPIQTGMVTEQISFVFGVNFLLSFQERKADFFEHLRIRLREDKGILRERRSDYLLYTMLESILDNYFKTLGKLDDEIDQYTFADLKKEPSPDILIRIEKNKKFVQYIKKSILPIKEFTQVVERGECQFIQQKHLKYFLEIKDLCLTLIDNCDMMLASLESATNLYFSMQGHRMNQVMKTLTVVSTIFIPLTFLAGIYGMNFVNMPELSWKYGYLALWMLIVTVFAIMVYYFRKKKWF